MVHELPSSMPVGQSRILLCHHSQFALSLVRAPLLLLTRANTSRLTEIFRFFSSASTPLPVEILNRSLSSLGSMYRGNNLSRKVSSFTGTRDYRRIVFFQMIEINNFYDKMKITGANRDKYIFAGFYILTLLRD